MVMERMRIAKSLVDVFCSGLDGHRDDLVIVDVGCGTGETVYYLMESGYDAFGCDLRFKSWEDSAQSDLIRNGRLRLIGGTEQKKLPFDDDFADIVLSDQVVEHIEDLDSFFREIARIGKPGSISMHYFPSENKPIEPHVRIPLATKFQGRGWIGLWQRGPFKGMPRRDWRSRGVDAMYEYLKDKTHYRSGSRVLLVANQYYHSVAMEPDRLLRAMSGRAGANIIRRVPGGPRLFNWLWSRFLVCRRPIKAGSDSQ